MAVVKANAYGHGMLRIAREAVGCGADYLGVARIGEALALRHEGFDNPILVFEIIPDGFLETAVAEDLETTIMTPEAAEKLHTVGQRLRRKAKIHVKVDTGMGRLGAPSYDATAFIERVARLTRLELCGVYSHFATSDEPDQFFARLQVERFQRVLDDLGRKGIQVPLRHMANSGAIISLHASHFEMVRPGIMLYGYTPARGMIVTQQLRPVMSLVSAVTFMKRVRQGTSISYGRRFHAPKDTTIATIPIGYGDGYSRNLTNRTDVLIRGERYPSVGTICMDHLMVDLGDASDVRVGDKVTLLGRDGTQEITAWDIADKLGTIPYEVTCMVAQRVGREYIG